MKRRICENRYDALCKVEAYVQNRDAGTCITSSTPTTIFADVRCRLVHESVPQTANENGAPATTEISTLLCPTDLDIPEGSRITVTQHGHTEVYRCSGRPALYDSHQEISLEAEKEYA